MVVVITAIIMMMMSTVRPIPAVGHDAARGINLWVLKTDLSHVGPSASAMEVAGMPGQP